MAWRTDRRRFLRRSLAMAVAIGSDARPGGRTFGQAGATPRDEPSGAKPSREAKGTMPIIDTHQHLWDLDRFRLPWLEADSPLARSFLMADYLKAAEGLDVVKSVYVEVDVEPAQQRAATLGRWVEALREIVRDRGEVERRQLFHDNALRVYRLA